MNGKERVKLQIMQLALQSLVQSMMEQTMTAEQSMMEQMLQSLTSRAR